MHGSGDLPSGDVTFVFTDIEGSTALLRELGDSYAGLLDRHREILRKSWNEYGGHELGTEGDSFLVAFADPTAAVEACVNGHVGLAAEPWVNGVSVRVRMGAHRGLATPRNGEYVSMTIHQAARVCSAAHGGQLFVTDGVAEACAGLGELTVESMGRFVVRDFDEPTEIHSVGVGPNDVQRAPRLVPADGHNLVRPTASLIGRASEIEDLAALLRPGSITTVVGPGGVGKTRLAIETGLQHAPAWSDGVWHVALGGLIDETGLASTIAASIGAGPGEEGDAWRAVIGHLVAKSALLILDNCEHLFPDISIRVADIVDSCPRAAVLCTSRETLGLREEQVFRLHPLSTEAPDGGRSEAEQLFVERVGPLRPGDEAALDGVADLCAELDGLPLAIELAASRGTTVTPHDILEAVQADASSLASRDPRTPDRQRTLQRTLAWSHGLLSADDAAAFETLSVFAAGFTPDAAAAVLGEAKAAVAPRLWALADRSLLHNDPAAGSSRLRMLHTVRGFARRQLEPERTAIAQTRLCDHFLSEIGPARALELGWPSRVGEDIHNIRDLASHADDVGQPLRQQLAWVIGKHHDVRAQYRSGVTELRGLDAALPEPTPERVGVLTMLADLHLRMGEVDEAVAIAESARDLADDVGRPAWDDAGVWRTLAVAALRRGDPVGARDLVSAGLGHDLSDRGAARLHGIAGISWGQAGEMARAVDALEAQLELAKRGGLENLLAGIHGNLAEAYLGLGDNASAARQQIDSLDAGVQMGQPMVVAYSCVLAAHLTDSDRWEQAAELQGAADGILERSRFVLFKADAEARERLVADLSARQRADRVSDLLSAGAELSISAATELARAELELTMKKETSP